jgi:trimeric autotransporter adhesin
MSNKALFRRAFICAAILRVTFFSASACAQQVTYSSLHSNSETELPQTLSGGTAKLLAKLQSSRSGISLAVADFDSDGVQDLVTGYVIDGGGALLLQRGSAVATAPTPHEWAMKAAGQMVTPFVALSEVTAIPVRPDFLRTADVGGHGHFDLIVAAKGGTSAYLLMGDGKGGFSTPQTLPLAGTISSLATWRGPDGTTYVVAGVCSAQGCGVQFLKADGTTRSFVATPAAVSAIEVGSLNRGAVADIAVVAAGSVVLIDGDSAFSGTPKTESLPVTNAAGIAAGSFVYDRRGYLQLAVLGTDATLHIFARAGVDTSLPTVKDVLANRLNERNHIKHVAAATPAGMAWSEVETLANIGPGSADPLMLRARLSGGGGDDLVIMAGQQFVQVTHPLSANGTTKPIVTVDSTSNAITAAVPARISADSRQGLITADSSLRPAISLPPTNHTFTVNTTVDGLSVLTTAGLCTNPAVPCTIRDAVGLANQDVTVNGTSKVDTINIPAGTYTFTTAFHPANDSQGNINYHYDLDASMNLVGAGSGSTIINGNNLDKVFSVDSGIVNGYAPYEVFISGMTIENGLNSNNPGVGGLNDFGGLMDWEAFGDGYLTLSSCVLNTATVQYGPGGGIGTSNSNPQAAGGVLELDNSTVSNGNTPEEGGALYVGEDNPLILNTDTLSKNSALTSVNSADTDAFGEGGGVDYSGLTTATTASTITNSTLSGNSTTVDGGGFYAGGPVTILGTSFTTNSAGRWGGGLVAGTLTTATVVTSSTFTGNSSVSDGSGVFVDADLAGNNLTMHYSRIHGNTGGTHTGIGLGATGQTAGATVNATDNWWGCNGAATGTGCDTGGATVGSITLSPYTTLTISLSATSLSSGASLTATGSLGQDSAATPTVYTTGEDTAYFGVPATLAIVQGASTTNSTASALNSSAAISTTAVATESGTATVTVDGTAVSASFTVTAAAPTVASISPNNGPVTGGTTVTITGTGFTGATAVMFGGTPAASLTVDSATEITAVSPAGSLGTVDVTVTTAGGTSATSPADQFTYGVVAPTITFSIANQTFGAAPFQVTATSNSSGAITYSLVSGNATVTSAGLVTLTGTGSVTVQASQVAAGNYTAGTAQATFTVSAEAPTIAFSIANQTFGAAPFQVTATSNSTGAITYSLVSGNATVTSAGVVTLTGIGSVTVQASQVAAGNYSAGTAQATFTVSAEAPTITFSIANQTFGATPFQVTATSNSTGAITYSVVSGNATVTSAGVVTLTGTGSVTLKASQVAAGNYTAGSAQATFTVSAEAPTITFSIANQTFGATPFQVTATSNSSGAITYSLVSGNATVTSAGLVTLTGTGSVTVQASQVAAGNYTAGTAQATFTVSAETPTITFSVPNQTYGAAPFQVTATSNSTGAITYSVVSGNATVTSAGLVTLTGTGSVTLKATQAAAGNYGAGTAQATFTVSAEAPTITFSIANQTFGAAPFQVTATSNSTGAITYSLVSGNATVTSAGVVTLTGTGSVTLQASQVAAGNYTAGTAQATFTVSAEAPTITFSIPNQTFGAAPFTVTATSNSTGAITYSLVSGNATVTSAGLVTLTGTGSVTVKASQVAAGNYSAGTAQATFTVSADTPTITFSIANQTFGAAPFQVTATSNSTGAITYSLVSGNATVTSAGVVTLTGTGSVTLQASQVAAGSYTAGTAQATFTVSAEAPTIAFSVPNQTYGVAPFQVTATSNSTGAITYSVVSGNATVTSAGVVTLTGTGSVTLQASQVAAGNYTAGTAQATFTVAAEAPTITFSVPNQTYGAAPFQVTATSNSSGAITYSLVSGNATVTSGGVVTLTGTGSVTLKATQAAAGNYGAGTAQATFTVSLQGTTTTLTASSASIDPNQTVTLTATVTPNTSGTPAGSVAFSVNGTLLATVPISGGVAQLTTLLPPGETAVITAVYSGDAFFMSSTGTTTVVVAPFDFTFTDTGASAYTVVPGAAATYNFALAPLYGSYAGPVSFTVTGLPPGATASFTPSSVAVDGGPTPIVMTVQTASAIAHNSSSPLGHGILLALLLLPFMAKRSVREKLKGRMLLLVLLMAGMTVAVTGCGTNNGFFLQSSQTYTLTVTATSGTLQHSQTVTLNVQ